MAPSRAYSPGQVAGATFLGSPIAGALLLASNFALFRKPDARRQALLWGGISTVGVFVLALFLPDNVPNSALPAGYTLALQQIAKCQQGTEFEAYIEAGGQKHSHWRVAGIGIACLIVVFLLTFAILMALPPEFLGE